MLPTPLHQQHLLQLLNDLLGRELLRHDAGCVCDHGVKPLQTIHLIIVIVLPTSPTKTQIPAARPIRHLDSSSDLCVCSTGPPAAGTFSVPVLCHPLQLELIVWHSALPDYLIHGQCD
jgi:hypothetical protein